MDIIIISVSVITSWVDILIGIVQEDNRITAKTLIHQSVDGYGLALEKSSDKGGHLTIV